MFQLKVFWNPRRNLFYQPSLRCLLWLNGPARIDVHLTHRSAYEPFYLDCGTLANLLCPTSSLCNQHFELIVDKTMFIRFENCHMLAHRYSYPSLLGKQTVESSDKEKSPADRRAASLSTFNFVLAIERNSINCTDNPSLVKMCSSIVKQVPSSLDTYSFVAVHSVTLRREPLRIPAIWHCAPLERTRKLVQ